MKSARGQLGLTASVLVVAALPFILTPWKAQALGAGGRGEVGFFGSAFTIVLGCAALGVRYAYYEARSGAGKRIRVKAPRLVLLAYGAAGVATVVFILIATRSMPLFLVVALVIAWLISPVQLFTQTQLAEAQASQSRVRVAALSSTPALFESVITLVLLVTRKMTVGASVVVTMFSELLRGLVAETFRRREGRVAEERFDLTRRVVVLAPIGLLPIMVANVDTVVFAWFVPTTVLGEYTVAKLAINVMLLIAVTIEGFVARVPTGDRRYRLVIWGLAACAFAGAVLGYYLTPILFGPEFEQTRYAFVVTSVAGWLGAVFTLVAARSAWNGRGRGANVASMVAVAIIAISAVLVGLLWTTAPAWALGLPAVLSYGAAALVAMVGERKGAMH